MRKNSIVREYRDTPLSGAINMQERANFLCGKMMDVEDTLRVRSRAIADTYDAVKYRAINSATIDASQTTQEQNALTTWVFEFDAKYLLREYLYNEIFTQNPFSVFNQLDQEDTLGKKSGLACIDYIDSNIIDRYRLKEFVLWTAYYELKLGRVPGSGSSAENPEIKLLSKTPVYNFNAVPGTGDPDNLKETIALKQYLDGKYEIRFKQKKSSQYFTFIYYYDAIYEKI